MDAAYVWHANHSHGGNSATAAWQRWPRRWRCQRLARSFQYPGRHGHGRDFRQFARLLEGAYSRRYLLRRVDETHYADRLEARPMGFVQLLLQPAEIFDH